MKNSASAKREGRAVSVLHSSANTSTDQAFLHDVLHGLAQPQKSIPPKYFYDARGSEFFEAICATPEYYPTRTEMRIMADYIDEMAAAIGPGLALIELGSGASLKTRLLIERTKPGLYVPIDVSHSALERACAELGWRFPYLIIEAEVGDFTELQLPRAEGRRRLVYFPGSTIGNFPPAEALDFLQRLHAQMNMDDLLFIGVDLKKDTSTLNAAYNDAQGVTAAFNLNLLERINRELGGDFDTAAFRHLAFYNPERGWVEMHLQSLRAQCVRVAGTRFDFREGETLHTEISCKYGVQEFQTLAYGAGFLSRKTWIDEGSLFSVHLMQAA